MQKIESIQTSKLIPYARNSRTHSENQIKKIASSIKEFGFINPVIIDKDNGIIAGHGRVMASELLNLDQVPCLRAEHLTEAQKKAYIIADNRLAEDAGWDNEMLKVEIEELQGLDVDIELLGFEDFEIEDILKLEEDEKVREDDFDEEEVLESIEEPKTKRGDIWLLGNHRLMCGDSTKIEDVKKLMDGKQADLLITDPPYNVNYEGSNGLKIQNDSMEDTKFREFLKDSFANADSVMKEGAVFYIWFAGLESYNFFGACKDAGWEVRQQLVWVKNVLVMGRQDYQWKHEPCLYGWKKGKGHFWNSDRAQTTVLQDMMEIDITKLKKDELIEYTKSLLHKLKEQKTTVLEYDKPNVNSIHPKMKPIKLFDYQIQNNTKSNDIVLDSFSGSGTTIMACEQNGRIAYGMELDERYCDVIVKRWEEFTGEKAKLLKGGD